MNGICNMGKIKEIWGFARKHKYAVTIVVFLLIICFFDQCNLLLRLRHQRQIRELKKEIEYYTNMRDQSIRGLQELTNDSCNLEHIAREKYGMHLPNEEIFIIK